RSSDLRGGGINLGYILERDHRCNTSNIRCVRKLKYRFIQYLQPVPICLSGFAHLCHAPANACFEEAINIPVGYLRWIAHFMVSAQAHGHWTTVPHIRTHLIPPTCNTDGPYSDHFRAAH